MWSLLSIVCSVIFGLLAFYVLLPVAVVLVGCGKLLKMKFDGTIADLRASIPFRRSHWLLGAVADMDLGGFHEFILQNTVPFGECKSWADFMFIHPMAFILDPRDTSFILGSGQQHFSKVARAKDLLSFFFGTSMVVLDGEPWKRIRKLFNPAFHFEAVNKTQPTIVARTVNLLNVLNKYAGSHPDADTFSKPTLDFSAHAQNLTLDVLGLIVFDFDMKCQTDETNKFRQALNCVIHETFVGFTRIYPQFSWKYLPSIRKARAKAVEAKQMIVDVIQSIIEQRRQEKENNQNNDFKRDLLGTMLQAKHDGVDWITDKMLVDEMMLFLMAGSDTTSWLLTMAIAYLVTNPEMAKKLYGEIDQFAEVVRANANGNKVQGNPTHHRMTSVANDIHYDENGSISVGGGGSSQWQGTVDDENDIVVPTSKTALQLSYLNAFVKETLRLQPPAPIVGREAIEPYVLPSGLKVHPGVSLTICPYVIHRSKALWGEDALEFKPERWLNPNAPPNNGPYKVPLSTAFVPFMAGQRNCIGQNLARLEAALVLSLVLQRFTFSFPAGFQVKTEFYLTMCMPGGLSVLVNKRKTRSFSSAPPDHDILHAAAASVAP